MYIYTIKMGQYENLIKREHIQTAKETKYTYKFSMQPR